MHYLKAQLTNKLTNLKLYTSVCNKLLASWREISWKRLTQLGCIAATDTLSLSYSVCFFYGAAVLILAVLGNTGINMMVSVLFIAWVKCTPDILHQRLWHCFCNCTYWVCSNIDDEDEMLYGESDTSLFTSSFTAPSSSSPEQDQPKVWVLLAL